MRVMIRAWIAVAWLAVPAALWAEPVSGVRWVNAEEGLRLRDAPSLKGKTLAVIPHFTELALLEEQGGSVEISGARGRWSRVEWRASDPTAPVPGSRLPVTGWVFGGFLGRSPDAIRRPAVAMLQGLWFESKVPSPAAGEQAASPGWYENPAFLGGREFYEFSGADGITHGAYATGAGGSGGYLLRPQMVVAAKITYGSDQDDPGTTRAPVAVVFRIESLTAVELRILERNEAAGRWQPRTFRRGISEIHEAIRSNLPEELERLLPQYGHDPNYAVVDRVSLLGWAVHHDAFGCASWLLNKGADPNAADANGVTPLHVAAFRGSYVITTLLLQHGARRETQDRSGRTPLKLAEAQAEALADGKRLYRSVIGALGGR